MTPHRFQSQSFKWLNRQRLRWNDRLQQGWRSVQVAVTWGLQVMLYPLYAAVQSSRLLLHKWQHSGASPAIRGDGGDSSRSSTAHASALVVKGGKSSPESTPDFVALFFKALAGQYTFRPRLDGERGATLAAEPKVQGIASLRIGSSSYPAGSLVWVDDRNQIWSVPLAYQQALRYQMLTIVVNHTPLSNAAPLKLLPERPQQFPLVRWTRRLVNWMQTSPLALATNLFQESQIQPLFLPAAPFPNPLPPQLQMRVQEFSLKQSDAMLRFLDYHLALLEPHGTIVSPQTINVQASQVQSSNIQSSNIQSSNIQTPEIPVPVFSSVMPLPQQVSQPPAEVITGMTFRQHLLASTTPPLKAIGSTLMAAAIPPKPETSSEELPSEELPSKDLSSEDLSSEKLSQDEPSLFSESVPLPQVLPPEVFPPQISSPAISSLNISPSELSPQILTPQPLRVSSEPPHRESIVPPRSSTPADLPPIQHPEEIEVKSEAIGYEKHPLEQLLHWIDRVVTWIEQQLAKLFQ